MAFSQRTKRLIAFYGMGILRELLPYSLANRRTEALLRKASDHPATTEIERRVSYYNKLSQPFDASSARKISEIEREKSRYYIDLSEHAKGFGPDRRLHYLFGDITFCPDIPSIVKSRPISTANETSVLLKLDKLRHFAWAADPLPFRHKKPAAVWRGTPLNEQRRNLVRMYYTHPTFDIGHSRCLVDDLTPKKALTHREQQEYQFFVSIEGHDVATSLKWAMASNMLVMSPKPRFETWFMEGLLKPDEHYVMLRDDLTDLEEKVDYYSGQTEKAESIVRNAQAWVAQFSDPHKEKIIATRVLEKYFQSSGQL